MAFTWTVQEGSGPGSWTSVASSDDGTKLAAVIYGVEDQLCVPDAVCAESVDV